MALGCWMVSALGGTPPSSIFGKLTPHLPSSKDSWKKALPRMVVPGQHLHKGAVGALAEEMAEHGCAGTLGPDVAT